MTERVILEPHGEPKYVRGPDGPLSYRITGIDLTRPNPLRAELWARIEADVLARNEPAPVDMYTYSPAVLADGTETEASLLRVRFDADWVVTAIEQVP